MGKIFQKFFFIVLCLFFMGGCGSNKKHSVPIRVGVDFTWYPYDFKMFQIQLKGFLEDLLMQMAIQGPLDIEIVPCNWDALFDGLNLKGKRAEYDCVVTLKHPYNFNENTYQFSKLFLPIGPVVVYPRTLKNFSFKKNDRVGVIKDHPSIRYIEPYPNLMILSYASCGEIFRDLERKNIDMAVLDRLLAISYVHGVFEKKYKLSDSLNTMGLRFASLKNIQGKEIIKKLNHALDILEKNHKIKQLKKKWQL